MSLITGSGRYLTRGGKEVDVFRSGNNFYPWAYRVSGRHITVDDDGYQFQSGSPVSADIIAKAPEAATVKEEESKKDDGGPAFPTPEPNILEGHYYEGPGAHPGMTLRDWFAGQALPAIIISGQYKRGAIRDIVAEAFDYADAMLAARGRTA